MNKTRELVMSQAPHTIRLLKTASAKRMRVVVHERESHSAPFHKRPPVAA